MFKLKICVFFLLLIYFVRVGKSATVFDVDTLDINHQIETDDFNVGENKSRIVRESEATFYTYDTTTFHLIVKGANVTLSDVVKNENWSEARFIEIFALNEIVINAETDKTGQQAIITIFAPHWKVSGFRTFNLNGENANAYSSAAENGFGHEAKGDDGKGGMPGGSAGHFYGVGITSHNMNLLYIDAIGGDGGAGQTGGKG